MSSIKKKGYWTKEKCREVALKYDSRLKLQKEEQGLTDAARRLGIWDDICKHMSYVVKKRGKSLTYEECKKIVSNYNTTKEFIQKEWKVYQVIKRKGWDKELFIHLETKFKPSGYWTKEMCREEALKYTTYKEFRGKNYTAYNKIKVSGWWNELCSHLTTEIKPRNYWTYERCKEVTLKYDDREEFLKNNSTCYSKILKNDWSELLSRFEKKTSLAKRHIYVFEFPDNHVYVGLTYNLNKRKHSHLNSNKSQVFKHIEKTGLEYKFKTVYDKPFPIDIAGKIEKQVIEDYITKGWIPLNISKPGGLGGGIKYWTFERAKNLFSKYDKISSLRNNIKTYIIYIIKHNGWWDELTSHMENDDVIFWDKEKVFEKAKKFNKISDFVKKYPGSTKTIDKLKIREELHELFKQKRDKFIKEYSKEDCLEVALRYKYKVDFRKNHKGVYNHSLQMKWCEDICKHMLDSNKIYWTYERCKEESFKYKSRKEMQINCKSCLKSIYKNKWYELLPPELSKGRPRKAQ